MKGLLLRQGNKKVEQTVNSSTPHNETAMKNHPPHVKERLLGFDIRHEERDLEFINYRINISKQDYSHITTPRSLDISAWPSRLSFDWRTESPDLKKAHYHETPLTDDNGKVFLMDYDYSASLSISVCTRLGDLLLLCPPLKQGERVAAFSVFEFSDPVIFRFGKSIFDTYDWRELNDLYPKNIAHQHLSPEEWTFLGYEATYCIMCQSLLWWSFSFDNNPGFPFTNNKNKYGLLDNFTDALKECQQANIEEQDHDTYFIYGIYEAKNREDLTLINLDSPFAS